MTQLIRFALLLSLTALAFTAWAQPDDAALDLELRALQQAADTSENRARLRALAQHEEYSRVPHPEHPALSLPRFDIAARAQQLLRNWDEQAQFEALLENPQLRSKSATKTTQNGALLRWIDQASHAEALNFKAQTEATQRSEALSRALALKLNLQQDWLQLAKIGHDAASLRAISLWALQLSPQNLIKLIEVIHGNPAFSGAAAVLLHNWRIENLGSRIKLAELKTIEVLSRSWLELAIANDQPELTTILAAALAEPQHAVVAAWGLWRLNTERSRHLLSRFADEPTSPEHLATEIKGWLQ